MVFHVITLFKQWSVTQIMIVWHMRPHHPALQSHDCCVQCVITTWSPMCLACNTEGDRVMQLVVRAYIPALAAPFINGEQIRSEVVERSSREGGEQSRGSIKYGMMGENRILYYKIILH